MDAAHFDDEEPAEVCRFVRAEVANGFLLQMFREYQAPDELPRVFQLMQASGLQSRLWIRFSMLTHACR